MTAFPIHHLSRSYLLGTPDWRVIDSGVDSMRLGNGVLRTRDRLGQAVYAIDLSFRGLTTADARILHGHYLSHKRGATPFLWPNTSIDSLAETLYETYWCSYDSTTPERIVPQENGYGLWNATITLIPALPTVAVSTLVAWWPMDEGGVLLVGTDEALTVGTDEVLAFEGGSDVSDATGNGHGGTASQSMDVMVAAGKLTSALTFNGSSDYVAVADHEALRLEDGGSILAWINPTGLGESDAGRIIDKSNTVSAGAGYYFALAAGNKLAFRVAGDTAETLSSANAVTIGSWQHVAVVFDAYGRKLYVNGVDVTASGGSATRLPAASTAELRLGNRAGATDRSFYGLIDDVRIHNRPLSSQELAAIYNSGSGTAEEVVP